MIFTSQTKSVERIDTLSSAFNQIEKLRHELSPLRDFVLFAVLAGSPQSTGRVQLCSMFAVTSQTGFDTGPDVFY